MLCAAMLAATSLVMAQAPTINYVKTIVNPTVGGNPIANQEISSVVADADNIFYSGWPTSGTSFSLVRVQDWRRPTPTINGIFTDSTGQARPSKIVLDGSNLYFGTSMGASSGAGAAQMEVYRLDFNGNLVGSGGGLDPLFDGIVQSSDLGTNGYQDMAMDPGWNGNNVQKLGFCAFGSRVATRIDLTTGKPNDGYLGIDAALAPTFWNTNTRGIDFRSDGNGVFRAGNDLVLAIRDRYESAGGPVTVGWSGAELIADQTDANSQWTNIWVAPAANGVGEFYIYTNRSLTSTGNVILRAIDGSWTTNLTGSPQGNWTNSRQNFHTANVDGTTYLFVSGFKGSTQGVDVFQLGNAGQITVDVTLGDWVPADVVNVPVAVQIVDAGDPSIILDQKTLNISGSNGSITFYSTARGAAQVKLISPGWLNKLAGSVNLGSTAQNASATLINGDIDGDNEVGPGDFNVLANNFLAAWDPGLETFAAWLASPAGQADIDGDGEVGPGDFAILANNFLLAGD